MASLIVLSPHYDDAVYSLGGTIAQFVARGDAVTIFTIMAGFPVNPVPDTPVLRDNHARWELSPQEAMQARRGEDQRAAQILGAEVQYLDVLDCLYRVSPETGAALYPSEESLWGDVHPQDATLAKLKSIALPPDVALIYAPLAVGTHVDHQIVRDWGFWLAANGYKVACYEDYPYMRDRAALLRVTAVDARLPTEPSIWEMDETTFTRKVAAMKAYRSQISSFWESEEAIEDEVRQTFTTDQGILGECVWPVSAG